MGTTAPKDYLICDGTVYNIADYSDLAQFFKDQLGSENYFGGDGVTTFAVPDMRNLFLRGYHGGTTALSGDVGKKQDATKHPYVVSLDGYSISLFGPDGVPIFPEQTDTAYPFSGTPCYKAGWQNGEDEFAANYTHYTSRPVNMAVLYCIKAIAPGASEEIYSTEETRIGTWIDGKPVYRKTFYVISGFSKGSTIAVGTIQNLETAVGFTTSACTSDNNRWAGNGASVDAYVENDGSVMFYAKSIASPEGGKIIISVEYTKTTD